MLIYRATLLGQNNWEDGLCMLVHVAFPIARYKHPKVGSDSKLKGDSEISLCGAAFTANRVAEKMVHELLTSKWTSLWNMQIFLIQSQPLRFYNRTDPITILFFFSINRSYLQWDPTYWNHTFFKIYIFVICRYKVVGLRAWGTSKRWPIIWGFWVDDRWLSSLSLFFPVVTYIQVNRLPEQEKKSSIGLYFCLWGINWIIVVVCYYCDLMQVTGCPISWWF